MSRFFRWLFGPVEFGEVTSPVDDCPTTLPIPPERTPDEKMWAPPPIVLPGEPGFESFTDYEKRYDAETGSSYTDERAAFVLANPDQATPEERAAIRRQFERFLKAFGDTAIDVPPPPPTGIRKFTRNESVPDLNEHDYAILLRLVDEARIRFAKTNAEYKKAKEHLREMGSRLDSAMDVFNQLDKLMTKVAAKIGHLDLHEDDGT